MVDLEKRNETKSTDLSFRLTKLHHSVDVLNYLAYECERGWT